MRSEYIPWITGISSACFTTIAEACKIIFIGGGTLLQLFFFKTVNNNDMSALQKKKPTPSQKVSTIPKNSPIAKAIPKKPSLVSKASSYSGSQKKAVAKRPRESEEEEEEWEELDEPEQGGSYLDEEAEEAEDSEAEDEDEYARLESEEELELRHSQTRSRKKPVSLSKPPPKKVSKPSQSSWWDVIKKGVEKIPLFSELQL